MTQRHLTAMRRVELSRPIRLALKDEILTSARTVFDYGCGRGDDLDSLVGRGFDARGWDPVHRPDEPKIRSDVVNLGYVVNVIEDADERDDVLRRAWRLARSVLVVSARLVDERDEAHATAYRDGYLTRSGTFQRFYEQSELSEWIAGVLDATPVAAGLGTYYVFRSETEREEYLASRFRRPVGISRRNNDQRFEEHREILEPLLDFVALRGRLPHTDEIANASQLAKKLGSIRKAFRTVQWATNQEEWDRVRFERSTDLLVYVALAQFHGRARFSELSDPMRRDVRAFFSSYKEACAMADELLFTTGDPEAIDRSMRASSVGKRTGNALYVHESALTRVRPLIRVYEGCARAYIGTVEGSNIIKLARDEPQISYLTYPSFEADPHPALDSTVTVHLRDLRVRSIDFASSANPPILHRKEQFVAPDHPLREKFARLTKQEERFGLFEHPQTIGRREGWEAALAEKGVELRGHRVVRT